MVWFKLLLFPSPWQASAGFNLAANEVLIHHLLEVAAFALAQPAGVAMRRSGNHAQGD